MITLHAKSKELKLSGPAVSPTFAKALSPAPFPLRGSHEAYEPMLSPSSPAYQHH